MSTIRTSKLEATSDHDFAIQVRSPDTLGVLGGLDIDATGDFGIPSGTTAQRPSTPSAGMIRLNTDTGFIEVYNNTEWVNIAAVTTYAEVEEAEEEEDDLEIVTNGLVNHWDVGNPASYPGHGTTIYNLSTASNNAGSLRFSGSPTPHREMWGGVIECDGSDHLYSEQNTNYNRLTVEMWVRIDNDQGGEDILWNKENTSELRTDGNYLRWAVRATNRDWFWESTDYYYKRAEPIHITQTYTGGHVFHYVNGELVHQYDYPEGGNMNANNSSYWKFNARSDGQTSRGNPGNHSLMQWRIYERALTHEEVRNNYRATCKKFGHIAPPIQPDIVYDDDLVLWQDSRYEASMQGGRRTQDLSPSDERIGTEYCYQGVLQTMNSGPYWNQTQYGTDGCIRCFKTNDNNGNRIYIRGFNLPGTNRTYEIWICPEQVNIGWQTWIDDGNERILFGTNTNNIRVYPDVTINYTIQTRRWYQLVYTLEGSICRVYVNGVEQGTGTYSQTLRSGRQTIYIGGDTGTENSDMFFSITRIYKRTLTAAEVLRNYNADKADHGLT